MHYVALGDSISIDTYTGVAGGGAASQFAKVLPASSFQNLTGDGRTTDGVIDSLRFISVKADVVTITAGGNDLLQLLIASQWADINTESGVAVILRNLRQIVSEIEAPAIILNTVYDPTDGQDQRAIEMGVPGWARSLFNRLNDGIRDLAAANGLILSDLEVLFKGHGFWSTESWIVSYIEPNYAGATAIAKHWLGLYQGSGWAVA